MKFFALSAAVVLAFAASTNIYAQTKTETVEPGTATELTGPEAVPGEMVVLPSQSQADAPAVVLDPEEPVVKNVAHKRGKKIGKMVNGYYTMEGNRDWGTNATLNGFGYEQFPAAAPYTPEADAPVFLAGDEEAANDGQAPAADWTDEPAAKTDTKATTKETTTKKKSSSSNNGSYNW